VSAAQQGNLKNRLERLKGENKALKEKLTSLKKEHRLVEKTLREGQQLLNNTPVALFLIQEGKIIMTNETAREWLGYKEEEILGRSFLDFVHPDSLDYVSVLHRKMISGRSVPDLYETYVIRKGGDTLYCEVQVRKIKFQGRRAFLMNLIGLDRRIQMERQRRRSEKMEALVRMASGLRQEFISCMSIFDNKSPQPRDPGSLTDTQFLGYLEKSESLREKENAILQKLAVLARIKKNESDAVLFDLKKNVQKAVMSIFPKSKEAPTQSDAEISIKTYLRKLAPVRGNPKEIQNVFQSMISNAVEALPNDGEIYLTTEEDSDFAYVYIQDNGLGIPKDIKGKIFDPFFSTKSGSSPGLGLSMANAIVGQHRGEIEVMSNEGQGTTFIVKLPLAKKPQSPKARIVRKRIKNSHILIISDGGIFKDLLCQLFISKGGKITSASSGAEGLKLLKKNKFDLVIVDLNVPYNEYLKIIATIKKIERGLPVALVAGDDKKRSLQALKKLGVDLIIGRPLEMDSTLTFISQVLSIRRSSE